MISCRKPSKLFISIFLVLFSSQAFSHINNIKTLSMDFIREEKSSTGEVISMSGTMNYQTAPYFFAFITRTPVKQTAYTNTDGTFLIDEDTLYDYSDGQSVLEQTCSDILNWFKSDCGLKEQGFIPTQVRAENKNTLVTTFYYSKIEYHPYEKIEAFSDEKNRIYKLKMYTHDNMLIAQTNLENFECFKGDYYPTKITTTAYNNTQPLITTSLAFSNIALNKKIDQKWKGFTLETNCQDSKTIIKANKITAVTPQVEKYTVSTAMMAVNGSFAFYKRFITKQDNSACPFIPTCSQYMVDAVAKYGPFGIIMGVERLHRCTSYEHSRNLYPVTSDGRHLDPVK